MMDGVTAFLIALMPFTVAVSGLTILLWPRPGFGFLAVIDSIFWTWAWKNRLVGPIKNDGGIVSFFPGLVVGIGSCASPALSANVWWNAFGFASTLLPVAHFLGAAIGVGKHLPTAEKLAGKYKKPVLWARMFRPFLWGMCAVFVACAARGVATAGLGAGKVIGVGGFAMSAVLIPVAKVAGDAINKQTHPKAAKPKKDK